MYNEKGKEAAKIFDWDILQSSLFYYINRNRFPIT